MLSRSRSTRTLALAAALVAAPPAAGPSGVATAQGPAGGAFAREPRTPLETWEVASYLVRVGEPGQAVPYLKKFLDSHPDDATLLAIRDTYGVGTALRLGDYPETRPYARTVADLLARASTRNATDPARIARSIEGLSRTREEQAYAVAQLREAGPYAVPPMIRALSVAGLDPTARAPIAEGLGRLDRSAVPPLIASLDSPDAKIVGDVARALGEIGDVRAVAALTYLAARRPENAAHELIDQAIRRLTGRPFGSQPRTASRVLTDEARKYHLHAYTFPGDPVVLWLWDGGSNVPAPVPTPTRDAEGLLGIRAAREAVDLDPSDVDAQVALLGLGLDHAPADWRVAGLEAGPDVLARVVRGAIADGRPAIAAEAVALLGRVVERDDLLTEGRPNALVEALSAPDRRVQLAAAEALVRVDPRRAFAGSSRVVPTLARFVAGQAAAKALVIDGNAERGSQVSGLLRSLGFDAEVAATGAQGFTQAADSADVELIVVDPAFINDPWRLPDLLKNLKSDPRTAGIPVFVVGPLGSRDRLGAGLESFPDVRFLVTPTEPSTLKAQLDRAFASMNVRPLSPQERVDAARRAAALLATIARRPGSPFEPDLPAAEPALTLALNGPAAGPDAAAVLGDVPGLDAQRSLADVALDPSRALPLRLAAAEPLARSIRRFGPKLADSQERRLVDEVAREADPALRDALAAVVGALKPAPDASGSRLQTYRAPSP